MNKRVPSKEPRGHHYIPQCYLKFFTKHCRKDEQLWVIDNKQLKIYNGAPKEVANRRDFFKIDPKTVAGYTLVEHPSEHPSRNTLVKHPSTR